MAITAYTLAQKVHFADMQDGDVAGDINDVLVVDSVEKTGQIYRSGVLIGTPFYFTTTQASALVTASWLTANVTFSGVPGGKGVASGWGAVVTGTTGATTAFTVGNLVSGRAAMTVGATLLTTNQALAALITDLTAAGIIGA